MRATGEEGDRRRKRRVMRGFLPFNKHLFTPSLGTTANQIVFSEAGKFSLCEEENAYFHHMSYERKNSYFFLRLYTRNNTSYCNLLCVTG